MLRHLAFRWFRWIRRRAIHKRLQEGSQPVSGVLARAESATPDVVAMHRERTSRRSVPSRFATV
jgi:hypothetical protein